MEYQIKIIRYLVSQLKIKFYFKKCQKNKSHLKKKNKAFRSVFSQINQKQIF